MKPLKPAETPDLLFAQVQQNIQYLSRQAQRQSDPAWRRLYQNLADLNEAYGKALGPLSEAARRCHALHQVHPQLDHPNLERDLDHLDVRFNVMMAMMADLLHTLNRLMTRSLPADDDDSVTPPEKRRASVRSKREAVESTV